MIIVMDFMLLKVGANPSDDSPDDRVISGPVALLAHMVDDDLVRNLLASIYPTISYGH